MTALDLYGGLGERACGSGLERKSGQEGTEQRRRLAGFGTFRDFGGKPREAGSGPGMLGAVVMGGGTGKVARGVRGWDGEEGREPGDAGRRGEGAGMGAEVRAGGNGAGGAGESRHRAERTGVGGPRGAVGTIKNRRDSPSLKPPRPGAMTTQKQNGDCT
jgi:hypothetical protein